MLDPSDSDTHFTDTTSNSGSVAEDTVQSNDSHPGDKTSRSEWKLIRDWRISPGSMKS